MSRRDPGFDVYIVAADILIGFLCTIFLLFAVYVKPIAHPPPAGVKAFAGELETHRRQSGYVFNLETEYSKVHLRYGERLLFDSCQWTLSDQGQALLREHFAILSRYVSSLARVQIEGHADARPADGCESLRRVNLRRDNWILSSLRALDVRNFLETELFPTGLPPRVGEARPPTLVQESKAGEMLRKIEAVGRGDLHPLDARDPTSEVNRRIEITVHFIEKAPARPARAG